MICVSSVACIALFCTSFTLSDSETRSSYFEQTKTIYVSDGADYNGTVYDSGIDCGRHCLTVACDSFAVSHTEGGEASCVFDATTDVLPKGNWNYYGDTPGNI